MTTRNRRQQHDREAERDAEMDELRQQVQQLQQQLAQLAPPTQGGRQHATHSSSESDEENINPFHRRTSHDSSNESDSSQRQQRNHNRYKEPNVKIDIPEFEGRMHPNDLLDWLHTIERVFEYLEVLE